ncbi:General transcription factor IIE subunit 1 [Entophlyctis luteolus]|nr:General transcription factor IIE subunit 1 [Entophlyctis luteolus]KAJ3393178.1 General transcription factor IIE subunit 1 [Entophlyctis sp. JEL0112]
MDVDVARVLRELVMRVARSYYQPHYIIILDLLAIRGAMREEDMATALRISPGDSRKLCKKLVADRIIKANSVLIELKHYKITKKTSRTYYYIDYKSFVNVLKFKMFKIQEVIRKEIDEHNNNLAYECPSCKGKYDPYAVLRMMRPEDGLFVCEQCQTVLEQEKGTDFENDLSRRFNMERLPILKLLQQTESLTIPEVAPPTDETVTATPSQGTSGQVYAGANEIKVELNGFEGDSKDGIANIPQESVDDAGMEDSKDSFVKDYYARLQAQAAVGDSPGLFGGAEDMGMGVGAEGLSIARKRAREDDADDDNGNDNDDDSDLDGEDFREV